MSYTRQKPPVLLSDAELPAAFAVCKERLTRAKKLGRREFLGVVAGAVAGLLFMAVMLYFGFAELAALSLGVVGGGIVPGLSLTILLGDAANRAKKDAVKRKAKLETVIAQRRELGAAAFAPFLPLSPGASAAYQRTMKKLTEEFYVRSATELRQGVKVGKALRFKPPV